MACTTLLVGKTASYDGSTLIARNDDSPSGVFTAKAMKVMLPNEQPREYVSKIAHCKITLPDNPLRYTLTPNVDPKEGIWGAQGINEDNVAMTATETITTNARVLGADPYVDNGIGEEDLVVLTLPYIHSAKAGVLRLGELLATYGTYEPNGIAFSDGNDIWWLETIGGHHWIARRVPDDSYVMMPNQFGLDRFDFEDAYGEQKENLCSPDLLDFVKQHHLDLGQGASFSPRLAFGSHSDSDHVYNTPRAWYMGRYFNPHTYHWDGENADFTPLSDDIPWCLVPERKITVEDVKYILSSHYQGTPYDPYGKDKEKAHLYRPIGVSRTSFLACLQIRNGVAKENAAIEWVAFGSNPFNAFVPLYTNVSRLPAYFTNATLDVDSHNFYWASRLIGALADAHYNTTAPVIQRYELAVASQCRHVIEEAEKKADFSREAVNESLAKIAEGETQKTLNQVLYIASCEMKNSFSLSDR